MVQEKDGRQLLTSEKIKNLYMKGNAKAGMALHW